MLFNRNIVEKPNTIFILCIIYLIHMIEEFTLGFVEWADRYFGSFNWMQNIIGNSIFMGLLIIACILYSKNPKKYLWTGMAGAMWVLANSFIHISATLLGAEYSPGVVTATILYIPAGVYLLFHWNRMHVLNWKNILLSFTVGGLLIMLLPTFVRAVVLHAKLAQIFHMVN